MKKLVLFSYLLLVASSLPAALNFTLTPAVQSGAVGTEVSFTGTLENTSATESLFLNDIQFNFSGPAAAALSPDGNVFFANVPGILLPGETYTGPIFSIMINSSAIPGDYSGSVTILGGTDIFAANNLQSQNVQISSPLVSISATTSDAYEFGAVQGVFTVSRSGSVNYDLSVNYTIAGSAMNGVRYNLLSGSLTFPSGAANAAISIDPIPNDVAEGSQTATLTISPFASYNIGSPGSDTVTIHDKPIDAWRLQEFGASANTPEIAGDTADPDADSMTNLEEYALFSDPQVASVTDLPALAINANHLQLSFERNTAATDITYIVEARADLAAGNWSPVITRIPGGQWSANEPGATSNETGSGNFVSVTVTDAVPIVDANTGQPVPHRFLRLRLQR